MSRGQVGRLSVCLVLLWLSTACSTSMSAGPLDPPNPHMMVVPDATEGMVFTDGGENLGILGNRPGTIESITMNGGTSALRFLGARIVLPARKLGFVEFSHGFPPKQIPRRVIVPAIGQTIRPLTRTRRRQGYELLLGFRVRSARYAVRRSITIRYRVGGELYRTVFDAALVVCPPGREDGSCMKQAQRNWSGPSG